MLMVRGQKPLIRWADLQEEYFITNHARERYLTRFLKRRKYQYLLEHGKKKGGIRMVSLIYDFDRDMKAIKTFRSAQRIEIDTEMRERLGRAEDRRSCLNDSEFMAMIHRKYGEQRFSFMVDEDALFVVVPHHLSGQKTVVTVIYTKLSIVSARTSFKKK
jgi:hypothetical protein